MGFVHPHRPSFDPMAQTPSGPPSDDPAQADAPAPPMQGAQAEGEQADGAQPAASVERRSVMKAARQKPSYDSNPDYYHGQSAALPIHTSTDAAPSVTSTSTFTSTAIRSGVFRLSGQEPAVEATVMDPVVPDASWMQSRGDLQPDDIFDRAVLVVSPEVIPEEIEALALSLFDDVAWCAPGVLRLHAQAHLHGPYNVPAPMSQAMKTRRGCKTAYVLHCPQERHGPVPEELAGIDPYTDAFADGAIAGLEDIAARAMMSCAARLCGQVSFMRQDTAHPVTPDPEASIGLSVYCDRLFGPETLHALLDDILPGLTDPADASDSEGDEDAHPRRRNVHSEGYDKLMASIDPKVWEEAEQLADKANREYVPEPDMGYALQAPVEKTAIIAMQCHVTDYLPPALRWEPWAKGAAACYEFRWVPYEPEAFHGRRPTRQLRIARAKAARQIEQAAVALAFLSDGAIIDEYGFLVGYR